MTTCSTSTHTPYADRVEADLDRLELGAMFGGLVSDLAWAEGRFQKAMRALELQVRCDLAGGDLIGCTGDFVRLAAEAEEARVEFGHMVAAVEAIHPSVGR